MTQHTYDPRDIPILTEAIDLEAPAPPEPLYHPIAPLDRRSVPRIDRAALQTAIVEDTLQLADSLTSQAAREIETLLFERVFGQLRALLPDLVERLIREQLPADKDTPGEPDG
ncbi:MAG: hypothetical protein ACHQIL_02525 [Steroidobacterales bacterium]